MTSASALPEHIVRISDRARRVHVRVGPRGVELVVPRRASLRRAQEFLLAQADWVSRQLDRQRRAAAQREATQLPAGMLCWRGTVAPLEVREDASLRFCARVSLVEGRPLVSVPPGRCELAGRALELWMREHARAVIEERVRAIAPALEVRPARIQLRDTRSRWGSCSGRGTLSFSWRLVMAPPEVLDYVVVHELAHLREHNHGPRFWALVARHDPACREHRLWLRRHADRLLAVGATAQAPAGALPQ